MRRGISAAIALATLLGAPAIAQQDRVDYRRALAAGYKASFLCSDLFNAGLSPDVVEQDDLKRTYPELEPLFDALPAEIDRANRRILVRYVENMPPRVAQWRPHLGCAQLPIGGPLEMTTRLPTLARPGPDRAVMDLRAWPQGDARAAGRANGDAAALNRSLARPSIDAVTARAAKQRRRLSCRTAGSSPSDTAPTFRCIRRSAPGRSRRAWPARSSARPYRMVSSTRTHPR